MEKNGLYLLLKPVLKDGLNMREKKKRLRINRIVQNLYLIEKEILVENMAFLTNIFVV